MNIDPITKIITYPTNHGTHIRDVKRREDCKGDGKYFCYYFCLFEDKTDKIVGLGTCYAHSGIEQYTQNNHPNYWENNTRYPA